MMSSDEEHTAEVAGASPISQMSVKSCHGKCPPRGLKLRYCFHKYVQQGFSSLSNNRKYAPVSF